MLCIIPLKYTNTQLSRLSSFHSRVLKIVFGDLRPKQKLTSIANANMTRACKLVRKCLDKETCEQLHNHFTLQQHEKQTRNKNYTYQGSKLSTHEKHLYLWMRRCTMIYRWKFRKMENNKEFEKLLKEHFRWHLS